MSTTRKQVKQARRPSLEAMRAKIDRVDFALLEGLAFRAHIAAAIAERKREQGLPSRDRVRERQLMEARRRYGRKLGLDEELVVGLFRLVLQRR